MIAQTSDEARTVLELALIVFLVLAGAIAALDDVDGKLPTEDDWGTGIMCPAAPRRERFPCEASWAWDRPTP